MEPPIIDKLRRDEALKILSDGREGVDVTLEYPGHVPASTRGERKAWLCAHFEGLLADLHKSGIVVAGKSLADEISTTGQSLRAVVPVEGLADLKRRLEGTKHKVEIAASHQAAK